MNLPFSLARLPIPLLAVVISCIFSILSISTNLLLNNDAYGYLRAAEIFNAEGIRPVLDQYGWYGYSILIALADHVLPGGLITSARVLNTLSYALLVFAFIKICSEQQRNRGSEMFAALVILSFPLLNEMRYFLIRDIAFWAFTLLGFLLLVRFARDRKLLTALYCGLALLAAIVFRLEGLLLAVAAPMSLLFSSGDKTANARLAAKLLLILGSAFFGIFLLALLLGVNLFSLAQYAYRFYLPLLFDFDQLVSTTALSLTQLLFTSENFPGIGNIEHGFVVLAFAYCYVVLANLVNALGGPITLLLIYAWLRGYLRTSQNSRWAFIAYVITCLIALLCFVSIMHFLTERYATLLCLLLLTLIPPVLTNFYEHAIAIDARRKFRIIFGSLYGYLLIDSLVSFGYSKQYLEDASAWVANELPASVRLHTNNYELAYASQRIPAFDKISLSAQDSLQQSRSSDYLMLDIKHDDGSIKSQLDANAQLELLQRFANNRGDEVRVYRQR